MSRRKDKALHVQREYRIFDIAYKTYQILIQREDQDLCIWAMGHEQLAAQERIVQYSFDTAERLWAEHERRKVLPKE